MNSYEKCQEYIKTHMVSTTPPIMPEFKDLTNQDYSFFHVISYAGRNKHRKSYWLCQCICGEYRVVSTSELLYEHRKSCGCMTPKSSGKIIHGDSKRNHITHLYMIWADMKYRCHNPKNKKYYRYGACGITVCADWLDKETGYENFKHWAYEIADPPYQDGLTIDRIDNDLGYCPENCRWLTNEEQQYNKQGTLYALIGNYALPIAIWAKIVKTRRQIITDRIKSGWSDKDAIFTIPGRPKGDYYGIYEIPVEYEKFNKYDEFINKKIIIPVNINDDLTDYFSIRIIFRNNLNCIKLI